MLASPPRSKMMLTADGSITRRCRSLQPYHSHGKQDHIHTLSCSLLAIHSVIADSTHPLPSAEHAESVLYCTVLYCTVLYYLPHRLRKHTHTLVSTRGETLQTTPYRIPVTATGGVLRRRSPRSWQVPLAPLGQPPTLVHSYTHRTAPQSKYRVRAQVSTRASHSGLIGCSELLHPTKAGES